MCRYRDNLRGMRFLCVKKEHDKPVIASSDNPNPSLLLCPMSNPVAKVISRSGLSLEKDFFLKKEEKLSVCMLPKLLLARQTC